MVVPTHMTKDKFIRGDQIDIGDDVSLGKNSSGDPMIYIKKDSDDIVLNGNLVILDDKKKNLVQLDQKRAHMFFKTDLFSVNGILNIDRSTQTSLWRGLVSTENLEISQFFQMEPQNISINTESQAINIVRSLILLTVNRKSKVQLILNPDIPCNTVVRVVVKANNTRYNEELVRISFDKYVVDLDDINDYLEFLVEENGATYIGGS